MNMQLMTIPFHGDKVFLADHKGEPYVPVKPIVDNLGLSWQPQHRKLADNRKRWGITMMVIPSLGGEQKAVTIPLRKLPTFLLSIDSRKVKPEIREKLEMYQEECDDALWAYWSKGHAVNHRHGHHDHTPSTAKIEVEESEYWKLRAELAELKLSKYIPSRTQRHLTDEEKASIDGLYFNEGYGYTRIADALGRNRSTIRDYIKRRPN